MSKTPADSKSSTLGEKYFRPREILKRGSSHLADPGHNSGALGLGMFLMPFVSVLEAWR